MLQVYELGKGLRFHFDKDETAFVQTGNMVHPIFSSVLYLTGGTTTRLGKEKSKERDGALGVLELCQSCFTEETASE